MVNSNHLSGTTEHPDSEDVSATTRKEHSDLLVLRAMTRKIAVTLRTLEQPGKITLSLSYSFEEKRGRRHRMIILAPHELLTTTEMRFVGFVSLRNPHADRHIIDEIFRTDERMLIEIAHIPGLFSYSSLELHPGAWYNLVLFRESGVKTLVQNGEVHRYAAHQLSPAYYAWIRLHNGLLTGGIAHPEFSLQSTKHYYFPALSSPPVVQKVYYKNDLHVSQS